MSYSLIWRKVFIERDRSFIFIEIIISLRNMIKTRKVFLKNWNTLSYMPVNTYNHLVERNYNMRRHTTHVK